MAEEREKEEGKANAEGDARANAAAKGDPAKEDKKEKRCLLGIEPVETEHEVSLRDGKIKYVARAGVLPLKDEFGETEAEIYFTAYERTDVQDRAKRPLTFTFNGGPGSSSIWLHMGAVGPKRVRMQPEGWMPAPPFECEDNVDTWLSDTDLVFIDPVGTGFSRAAKPDLDKKFWSYEGDIQSVGEFIRLYLTRYERWHSPLFLAGESYGTTRAAALSGHLVDKGIAFNGISLISTALDLSHIVFFPANDLPYQLFVPTYAAAAWHHGKLADKYQAMDLAVFVNEVKAWAQGELTTALMEGDEISEKTKAKVARQLAAYTGLDKEYVLGSNLRVEIFRFCKELLREERRSIGRFDARFKGVEGLAVTERPEFDPSGCAITPPYTSVFNRYVRSELGIETDLPYELLNGKINRSWEWEKAKLPTTGEILRSAMAKNPFMKVFVSQGYYDLATPLMATEYVFTHMNVDEKLRANISMKNYKGGHMFYLDVASLAEFRKDVGAFYKDAC